jgi:hypothetical protein
LLHDLTADEDRREATLSAAAGILRRRRQWRLARQTLLLSVLVAATLVLVGQNDRRPIAAQAFQRLDPAAAPSPVRELTDQQLLALFPNTPVGLATLPNGKKLLLFLRPADAARYVTRL